ncbi:MAG: DUF5658 family protein [Acidobacteria bacterium]|nr:DUF5658 family protein [Acidobacteriota bacterium]
MRIRILEPVPSNDGSLGSPSAAAAAHISGMTRVIATATMMMLLLPPGAAALQRLDVLGRSVELPAPTKETRDEAATDCEPRSPWLRPMLATHAALHLADAHSTRRGIQAGATEANPLMRWAVTSDARAYGVKVPVTAGSWWLVEQVSCAYPSGALWTVIAVNAVLALVVRHNYALGTRLLEGR